MAKFFIFDTETTGLPSDYKAHPTQWPRLIEIAWGIFEEKEGQEVQVEAGECETHLIKPDGWVVPDNDFQRNRGYTQERSMAEGEPLIHVLKRYMFLRSACDYTIGHNLSFDANVMRGELMRNNLEPEFTSKKICTMLKSMKHVQAPRKEGNGIKFPTLGELYQKLFDANMANAHIAGHDMRATAECFFELKRLGVITL